MNMVKHPEHMSPAGVDFLANHEGFIQVAKKVTPGEKHFTIGFGHAQPDVKEGDYITRAQALELLAKDVQEFEQYVKNLVKVETTQSQFDALVSFCYNRGPGNMKRCRMLQLLNSGDYLAAADAFPDRENCKAAGGIYMEGLRRRREDERGWFLND